MAAFSFLTKLLPGFGKQERASLENPNTPLTSAHLPLAFGGRSSTGETISVETVLSLSAVWRAVRIVAETLAGLPFNVVEQAEDGTRRLRTDHYLYRIINDEPGQLYTAYTFWETMLVHAQLLGNAFAVIKRDRRTGQVRELLCLDPSNIEATKPDGNIVYTYLPTGQSYRADEMLHIVNTSWNALYGLEIITTHRETFGLALANKSYGNNFYANGAQLSGIIKHPDKLTQEVYERLRASWQSRYGGSANAGGTAVLEEGMDFQAISLNPNDAGFSSTQKMTVADIARVFGVPQYLLEDLERATFNNIEHLGEMFKRHTIKPWARRIEAECNRKLFAEAEKYRVRTMFDLDDLARGDMDARSKYYSAMRNMGAMSPNDIRREEGMQPREGGDAYDLPLASNIKTVENNEPTE